MTRKSRIAKYIPQVSRSLHGLLGSILQRHASSENETSDAPNRIVARWMESNPELPSEAKFSECLNKAINEDTTGIEGDGNNQGDSLATDARFATPMYIVPLYGIESNSQPCFEDEMFTFYSILPTSF